MRMLTTLRIEALLLCAAAALFHQVPAHAGMCTLTDSGDPITTVNPKPFTVPPPSTCLENGLPGAATDLSGYVQVATTTRNITVSGVHVGDLYDRVYCIGTSSGGVATCDSTNTYILAFRAHMLATPLNFPMRNANCPVWSGTSNDCFEINNFFRLIRGTSTGPITASVGYWIGSGAVTDTNPDTALSVKYVEYVGKTFQGLGQFTPGVTTATRDNTHAMFWVDTNVFDPDGVNNPWSPWMYIRQNCPNTAVVGGVTQHYTTNNFAVKYWEGGEEGQIQDNIQAVAYNCVP